VNRFTSLRLGCLAAALTLLSCTPKKAETLLGPSQALGAVLAEEAIHLAGTNKTIALILPDARWGPASTVETALKSTLHTRGCSVIIAKTANTGDPMFRSRAGLQADDFLEAMRNAARAGAVVSIAGAPLVNPDGGTLLTADHPPVLVVATTSLGDEPGLPGNRARLKSLLEARIIQLAIVDGAENAGRSSGGSDPTHSLFDQNYAVLRQPN